MPYSQAIFYRPEVVPVLPKIPDYLRRAELLIEKLKRLDGGRQTLDIRSFEPASIEELKTVHDAAYVDGVIGGTLDNGYKTRHHEVATAARYGVGAMLAAARHVVGMQPSRRRVACAPVHGFSQAGYAAGGAGCTFNGLVAAAAVLQREGLVRRVAIVDCNYNRARGTDDIIERLGLSTWLSHFSGGSQFLRSGQSLKYLEWMRRIQDKLLRQDLVLYQAGADLHVDDPMGGVLKTEQLYERDQAMREVAMHRVPLVWNIGGGYQVATGTRPLLERMKTTLDIHHATMKAFHSGDGDIDLSSCW